MSFIFLLYLFTSVLIFFLPKRFTGHKAIMLMLMQAAAFIYFLYATSVTTKGNSISENINWIPALGLNLNFLADGISVAFALLVTSIGILVFLYAHLYMKKYEGTNSFYLYLNLFGASMLGLVLSGNLIQLFIFWELTSFLSYFLISFFHEKKGSRNAQEFSL